MYNQLYPIFVCQNFEEKIKFKNMKGFRGRQMDECDGGHPVRRHEQQRHRHTLGPSRRCQQYGAQDVRGKVPGLYL